MIRQVIKIDEEKCVGCGLCANACHQGAIAIIDKKAKLLRDDYCDGLGMCLPVCPTNAISFEQREADEYNKNEAPKHKAKLANGETEDKKPFVCPSTIAKTIKRDESEDVETLKDNNIQSRLTNFPIQIKLVPPKADFYNNSHLLISADCVAYAYAGFHEKFMKNKVTVVGCPKLDDVDYQNKLTDIISNNEILSVTVVRMEVPCCGGIVTACKNALVNSGKMIPWKIVTITIDGKIIED